MIATSTAHEALLASRAFWFCDLYEWQFLDGSFLRMASGGKTVVWNGQTYSGAGALINRGSIRLSRGLDADELKITIRPKEDDLLLGINWYQAVNNGAFDGATLTIYRVHAATPGGLIVGGALRFTGPVDQADADLDIELSVKSYTSILGRQWPRAVFQPNCDRTVFDAGCGLSRAAHQVGGGLLASSTATTLHTGLTQAADYYDGGEIRFTSGVNSGARRTIKTHTADGTLTLAYPLANPPAAGDAFVIWPGCDGTWARCKAFGNQARFRGEPVIPSPETSY